MNDTVIVYSFFITCFRMHNYITKSYRTDLHPWIWNRSTRLRDEFSILTTSCMNNEHYFIELSSAFSFKQRMKSRGKVQNVRLNIASMPQASRQDKLFFVSFRPSLHAFFFQFDGEKS